MDKPQSTKAFLDEIQAFLETFQPADITELEWEKEGFGCRVAFGPARKGGEVAPTNGKNELTRDLVRVVSPVVGTFHFADRNAPVGSRVKVKEPLGYVRAVNVQHWVEVEKPGKLSEVHVEEGQTVEFGQLLFTLEV